MKTIMLKLQEQKTAITIGVFAGLLALTGFFASEASFYAFKAHSLELDRRRMDKSLVEIEASMKQIMAYKDRIDALTTSTVEKAVSDARPMERQLKKVRLALEEFKNYTSAEERELNTAERMADLYVNTQRTEQTLRAVSTILTLRKDLLDGIPSITPASGWISSNFGARQSPFTGENVIHRGIDIGAEEGVQIYATADGVVEKVLNSETYGKLVILKHPFDVTTRFAHTSKIFVKEGQKVSRGDLVAAVGTTGRSTGPHLHYEVWVGEKAVDPMDYLLDREFLDVDMAPQAVALALGGEDLPEGATAKWTAGQAASDAPVVSLQANPELLSGATKRMIAWAVMLGAFALIAVLLGLKGLQPKKVRYV